MIGHATYYIVISTSMATTAKYRQWHDQWGTRLIPIYNALEATDLDREVFVVL